MADEICSHGNTFASKQTFSTTIYPYLIRPTFRALSYIQNELFVQEPIEIPVAVVIGSALVLILNALPLNSCLVPAFAIPETKNKIIVTKNIFKMFTYSSFLLKLLI
jgi:hypothetical protein